MTPFATLDMLSATQLAHALTAHLASEIGIRAICVKGPVLADQGLRSPRVSSDADVLVEPGAIDGLVAALRSRGWSERFVADVPRILRNHARTLTHPEWPCDIDLHHGFLGFLASDEEVFEALWERRSTTRIADVDVICTDPVANSAMLALHCLREMHVLRNRDELDQLTAAWSTPRPDLDSAELISLATRTGAVETLRPFFERIGLRAAIRPHDADALAAWTLHTASVGSGRAAAWLAAITAAGWRQRPQLLVHAIFPPEEEYRLEHPEIERGRVAFARAIARRGMKGFRDLPTALKQLEQARRISRELHSGEVVMSSRARRSGSTRGSVARPQEEEEQRRRSVAIIGTRGYPSYYGGFETAVRRIAPYLVDRGWDVTVYGRDGSTKSDDRDRDPRVITRVTAGLETRSLSTLTYGLTACLDALRREPDVALVMNVANGFWLPLLSARGIPSAVNVDGVEWDRAKWGPIAKNVFRSGARATALFGDELIFDAEAIATRWQREFRRTGTFIPYGGDDPGELPVVSGFPHRGYILVVARFVPENTVAEFLDAAEVLAARWPVVIVGSSGYGGELDARAERLAVEHRSVTWLGHVSDDQMLFALWQHAGAYFHGHSVGGTNPALVQAMSCGAPTVARDTVYNREVLGVTAEYAQPAATAIIEAVSRLMEDPGRQERLSAATYARGREHYSWEAVCEGYEATLRSLVTSRRRRR